GSSSRSVVPDSLPPFAQLIAGSRHSHLEGRDAGTRERCPLFVTQLFDILQEKCFSQQRIQLVEYSLNKFFVLTGPGRRLVGCIQQKRFFAHENAFAMRTPGGDTAALIDEDSIQPRTEAVPLLIPAQRPIGAKE